jgi:hypothetical protein
MLPWHSRAMRRWLNEAMRPGPTRRWPMGGGDEAIDVEAGVLVSWMSRWGESMVDQGGLRGRGAGAGQSVDAMPLLSRTLENRADGVVHHSQITNSRFTCRVSRHSGRNRVFPLSIEQTLGDRIRGDNERLKMAQLNHNPIGKLILFLRCIAGLHSIYF